MGQKSELFCAGGQHPGDGQHSGVKPQLAGCRRDLAEIAIVFAVILVAVWTRPGHGQLLVSLLAMACVVGFALAGKWSPSELGLTQPLDGAVYILLAGALACGGISLMGIAFRSIGPGHSVPLTRSWQYAIWALQQEFILQCIFFVRLEEVVGSRRAVLAAATLFALVHIPSPLLTSLSLLGGILFCELFRRWRNLYAIGIIHAALGLTIAASFPDRWLHHMRVGIGFLVHR
jgi:hypothetical protein